MSHGEGLILHAYYDQDPPTHLWDERKQPRAAPPLQRLSPLEEQDEQPQMRQEGSPTDNSVIDVNKAETPLRKYQIIVLHGDEPLSSCEWQITW